MIEFLTDYTIQNVAMGAALVGIVSGVLGCFAVLRRQSLLGDTLSHAALPGICLGYMIAGTRDLGAIFFGALVTGTLAALFMLALTRGTRLKTDAALGSALSIFFAIGVVLLTFIQATGTASQGGLDSFLFGQAAAILRSDLWIMGAITGVALGVVALFWKEFKLVSFDPVFAASIGLPVAALEVALMIMIALAVVVGLQMVGVVLMAAMIIAPAVAARQWTSRLETMIPLAAAIGATSGVAGAIISATGQGLSTGPLIVLAATAVVMLSLLFAPGRGLLWSAFKQAADRRQLRGRRVLATLYRLAAHHGDPGYPAEEAMLDAYHGTATGRALHRLETQGHVTRTEHAPEHTAHWTLTPSGIEQAERSDQTGRREP